MDKHKKTACPKFRKVCPLADLGCPDKSTVRGSAIALCGGILILSIHAVCFETITAHYTTSFMCYHR